MASQHQWRWVLFVLSAGPEALWLPRKDGYALHWSLSETRYEACPNESEHGGVAPVRTNTNRCCLTSGNFWHVFTFWTPFQWHVTFLTVDQTLETMSTGSNSVKWLAWMRLHASLQPQFICAVRMPMFICCRQTSLQIQMSFPAVQSHLEGQCHRPQNMHLRLVCISSICEAKFHECTCGRRTWALHWSLSSGGPVAPQHWWKCVPWSGSWGKERTRSPLEPNQGNMVGGPRLSLMSWPLQRRSASLCDPEHCRAEVCKNCLSRSLVSSSLLPHAGVTESRCRPWLWQSFWEGEIQGAPLPGRRKTLPSLFSLPVACARLSWVFLPFCQSTASSVAFVQVPTHWTTIHRQLPKSKETVDPVFP